MDQSPINTTASALDADAMQHLQGLSQDQYDALVRAILRQGAFVSGASTFPLLSFKFPTPQTKKQNKQTTKKKPQHHHNPKHQQNQDQPKKTQPQCSSSTSNDPLSRQY